MLLIGSQTLKIINQHYICWLILIYANILIFFQHDLYYYFQFIFNNLEMNALSSRMKDGKQKANGPFSKITIQVFPLHVIYMEDENSVPRTI